MKTLYLILLLGVASCGKDTITSSDNIQQKIQPVVSTGVNPILIIPDEIKETFNLINSEFIIYAAGGEGIKDLIIEFSSVENEKYENEARGYCDKSGDNPRIYLYESDWIAGPIYDYQRDSNQKLVSLYHLIGHCVFDKPHNDELASTVRFNSVDFNYPKSYMHSEFKGSMMPQNVRSTWILELRREYWNYYGSW